MPTLRVIALYVKPMSGMVSEARETLELRPNFGIVGDHHTGPTRWSESQGKMVANARHFTAVTPGELGAAAEALGVPYIDPAWIGANLVVGYEGDVPFTTGLTEGTRLLDASGNAVLVVEGETDPCTDAGGMIARAFPRLAVNGNLFPKCAIGRRGIYGTVLAEATIRIGDVLTVG